MGKSIWVQIGLPYKDMQRILIGPNQIPYYIFYVSSLILQFYLLFKHQINTLRAPPIYIMSFTFLNTSILSLVLLILRQSTWRR